MPTMSKSSDRKILGRTFKPNTPRNVRFSFKTGPRETLCLTDVVRDMLAARVLAGGTEWTVTQLAAQMGIPTSTLHALINGERDPNLTHLERICALGKMNVIEALLASPAFFTDEIKEIVERGENPFADLRLRGNLTTDQIERIGLVAEQCAARNRTEWLVELIEKAAEVALNDDERQRFRKKTAAATAAAEAGSSDD